MGEKDISWKKYFSDNKRYADLVNGIGCKGEQIVSADELQDMDTQTGVREKSDFCRSVLDGGNQGKRQRREGRRTAKYRDLIKKTAFGVNFAIIGIENQEEIDYLLPLRNMSYDVGEYERQAVQIKRRVREQADWRAGRKDGKTEHKISSAEYLYGFTKESRLFPVVTFILYYGKEDWNGSLTLHGLLDFSGIPESLKAVISDYRINLIEVRKMEDTSVFKTDIRQVFDFIRCSEDEKKLRELIENNEEYQNMEEDAFDVAVQYTNAEELIRMRDYCRKEGKVDMCEALTKMLADEREVGIETGRAEGEERVNQLIRLLSKQSRLDEISEMVNDKSYQQKLFEEFHI